MEPDTTRSLSRILERMQDQKEADDFIEANQETEYQHFYQYLNAHIAEKELDRTEVIRHSGISGNYVYNLLNGNRTNPGRDKVIALCVAAGMSYAQTQKSLELSSAAPLYPRDPRDVRIAIAINKGIRDVTELNLLLDQYDLPPLNV